MAAIEIQIEMAVEQEDFEAADDLQQKSSEVMETIGKIKENLGKN